MSDIPELKPCPFCGGYAVYDLDDASIECGECPAMMYFGQAGAEAGRSKWNHRAPVLTEQEREIFENMVVDANTQNRECMEQYRANRIITRNKRFERKLLGVTP